jgi:hypothetical protein
MNSSPDSGPLKRARQSELHLRLKQQVATELALLGFDVMFEFRLADVVGFHLGAGIVVAVEIELSSRNVVSNLLRNLGNGFTMILIAVRAPQVGHVERLIHSHLAAAGRGATVSVFGIDDELLGLRLLLEKFQRT